MSKKSAPAVQRNRDPIYDVLKRVLPPQGDVLEIAAGSGEHAAYFAPKFPGLTWQPTDPNPDQVASIDAWGAETASVNLLPALTLDVLNQPWPVTRADAVICINMIHISPWACTLALLDGAAKVLPGGGALYLYGPYRVDGQHTAPSNVDFDGWLKAQNPEWGVRELGDVTMEAEARGFALDETVDMPANNFSVIFEK